MGPAGLNPARLASPAPSRRGWGLALSLALHLAAMAALLAAGSIALPPEPPGPLSVELAFLPAAPAPAAPAMEPEPPAPVAEAAPSPAPVIEPAPSPAAAPAPPPRSFSRPQARPPGGQASAPSQPAAASAAAAQATEAAPAAATGPSTQWVRAMDAWIDAHLDYPEESRRRGEQGAVLVRFTVARDGRLLDFALLRGSGYDDLDDATRALFRHARLPPAPLGTDPAQATLSKPVRFELR